ncbi:glycyl radical protein [Clostridium sp. 'White wine YQ']|uniref:glycyl radical protein n=1 Tax=Clostridium sp. 'White wine YQ' TaxID=3027474 RepID=UPI00236693A7|nr:glycyl radical protein [Clostridium sp. 'White wine YQ']MDD7793051.1 glycyl radical protein [Clostridium sp. 'White wine YQ']
MKSFEIKSERIKKLRESVLSQTPMVCIERARYITEAYKENEAQPIYIKRARAVEKILRNMSIYIKDGELIVGNQASEERTAPIFPEYAVDWMEDELNDKGNFNKRDGDNFYLPEEHIEELREIIGYWKGKTLKDKCMAVIPEEVKKASEIKVIHGEGNMTSGDGHIVPDFEKALKLGLNGIIKEAEERFNKIDISDDDALREIAFLQSIIIINKSIIEFGERYSRLAYELSEKETDEKKKEELIKISKICKKVPGDAPESFEEALQMIWFIHLVIQIESNGHSASLGRVDQYLNSYYMKDIKEGIIDREYAKELLQCLWIKLYSILKIRSTSHSGYGAGYPTYQNVTIGGTNSDFTDAVNELSFLILESVGEAKLTQPNLSARVHANTSERFLRECAEVISTGFGMPALHNDDIIIPALLNKGVYYKDAYNYTMVGCVEVAVPGKWGYRCTGMTFLNFIKAFELTLNDGFDKRTGYILNAGNGSLKDFKEYEDLWKAWEKNIEYYTKLSVVSDKVADVNLLDYPDIFCSSLIDNCIERCKTIKEGGAVYDIISGLQVGLANAANSFAALKKFVYEDKLFTLEEIKDALDSNFEGVNGERIRKVLEGAPKYGNDNSYVDNIAVDVYETYIKEISKYNNTRYGKGPIGGNYGLSTSGISSNVPMGCVTGATPDGRKAWTPAAEGCSPVQGTDTKGPTSVLKTVSKLPNILMTGGQLLNVRFTPNLVNNDIGFEKFIMFIKSFIAVKGWHIQFNIMSTETLRNAQKNPEEYRDIIVRVAGYCAQFVTLDATTQEDIISRTEQRF